MHPRRFESPQTALTVLLVIAGATLRLWQYLANSSLWIDELALARNIIERPAAGLVGPLDYAQVAPLGFLLIQKAVTSIAGTSEMALRAFPLACGLGALLLFWGVSRRILSGWSGPFAVGLFALGIPFIYFSSQVKQVPERRRRCLARAACHDRNSSSRRDPPERVGPRPYRRCSCVAVAVGCIRTRRNGCRAASTCPART